jgi:predicted protein tyrosine phosphatase
MAKKITICGWRDADRLMEESEYDVLISIGNEGKRHCSSRVEHNFIADVSDVHPLCHKNDKKAMLIDIPQTVVKLIKFARGLDPEPLNVISHCRAGSCRSTASALIFMVARGMDQEKAVDMVYSSRGETCAPNWYFLAIADRLMETNILGTCQSQGRKLKSSRRDLKL